MKNISKGFIALVLCFTMFTVACTVDQVLSDIDVAIQIAASLAPAVGTVAPADGAIISVFSKLASSGVNEIKAAYDAWHNANTASNLVRLQATVKEVNGNLTAELATAKISDPKTVTAVTNWCNLLYATLNAVAAALPQPQGAVAARSMSKPTELPTPESLQARWSIEVCKGDAKCSGLVKVHHKTEKASGIRGFFRIGK